MVIVMSYGFIMHHLMVYITFSSTNSVNRRFLQNFITRYAYIILDSFYYHQKPFKTR